MPNGWVYPDDVTGTISRDFDTDKPRATRNVTDAARVEDSNAGGWRRARGVFRSETPSEVLIRRLRDDGLHHG